MKKIVCISKVSHIADLQRLRKERGDFEVLALGKDVELELEKLDIDFRSGKELRQTDAKDRLPRAEKMAQEALEQLPFFSYRTISLSHLYGVALQDYFLRLLYYLDIFQSFFAREESPFELIVLSTPEVILETSGIMLPLMLSVIEDSARFVAAHHGSAVTVLQTTAMERSRRLHTVLFNMQRALFGVFMRFFTACIGMLPKRKIRILATDYWKNIGSIIEKLPDAELALLDRTEFFNVSWPSIVKHRMRFVHLQTFVSRTAERAIMQQHQNLLHMYAAARADRAISHSFRNFEISPLMEKAVARIIEGSSRAMMEIEGAYALLKTYKPDVVLVRAGVSAQTHFAVLCEVARVLGIPSLEIQHGLFYLGPGSYARHRTSEYIATYGPLASAELKHCSGYTDETLINAGSPRFDNRHRLSETATSEKYRILCISPEVLVGSWNDTYDVFDFYAQLAEAARGIDSVEILMKLRSGGPFIDYQRQAVAQIFEGISHRIFQKESLSDVLAEADIVASCYSTALLEVLMAGKPLIYAGLLPIQDLLGTDLVPYVEAGALTFVRTPEEYQKTIRTLRHPDQRSQMSQHIAEFMNRNYSFHNNAAGIIARFIQTLAHTQ